MERKLLNQLYVFDFVPGDQHIVAERLAEMDKSIAGINSAIRSAKEILPTLTESEVLLYTPACAGRGRTQGHRVAGEAAAISPRFSPCHKGVLFVKTAPSLNLAVSTFFVSLTTNAAPPPATHPA
ncbi:hypothetical protein [Prosthecobacter vanneervenii]|uniref:Uncharacterized protein n=1 Tax=Prosthecobacter vanneervenii TaxID=48466 RepID=A0A7W8DKT7_9BACT|nr:hypothetical protein [Prosthecobacter vanneervenii]MBB5033186.1 hypothetical protein [Prosthecobacter vanneervenii]